jgi:hypothetical protein
MTFTFLALDEDKTENVRNTRPQQLGGWGDGGLEAKISNL